MSKMSSSSKELSKFEKEKQKLIQEKCQGLLNEMLRDDDNKYCVDCDAKGPRWASWNLGIFLCIRCAGIHRNLGVHISRVKSVNLDSWTPEQVVTMQQMGNSRARAVYEANLPDNFRRPQTDVALENFIRAKYEHTKYIAQEWVKPAPPRVDWNAEIEEQIRKKKEKSRTDSNVVGVLPKIGSGRVTSPSNTKGTSQVKKPLGKVEVTVPAPLPPVQATSASDDLLGLSTGGGEFSSDPFASPVKSTNSPVPATSSSATPAVDDLGSVFTSSGDGGAGGKMSKESILSLYGSLGGGFAGGGGGGGGANQLIGGNSLVGNNPFVQGGGGGFGGAGGVGGVQSTNPFPGWGGGGAELGNGFGGMQSGGVPQQQSNVAQLQQGLFSLNLSTPSGMPPQQPQPSQNSNMLFNTNTPNSTPNLNLNPMVNTGGFFTGLANTSISSPPNQMTIPPGQQFSTVPPQQPVTFNQFQSAMPVQAAPQPSSNVGYGVFQNGGSGGGGSGVNHVDLLWK